MKKDFKKNLWQYIFPALSIILWVVTIVLFFKANSSYNMTDIEAQRAIMNAARWHPACCIGAIISTAATWVVSEIADRIDE